MSRSIPVALIVLCLALLAPARSGAAQSAFRTSLTATISRLPADTVAGTADSLGCRRISLHWQELSGAHRYVVYASSTGGEPWVALPSDSACGTAAPEGRTGLSDVQATKGGASNERKVHYKVVALAGDGAEERTLDTTTVVTVELR